jgi:hypothetical protein
MTKNRASSTRSRSGVALLVSAAMLATGAMWRVSGAAAAVAAPVSSVTAQPANGGSALVSWAPPVSPAGGYMVKTFDVTSMWKTVFTGSSACWACTSTRVKGLIPGRRYSFVVEPVALSAPTTPTGRAAQSNTLTATPDAAPASPTAVSATPRPGHVLEVKWQVATVGSATDYVIIRLWSSTGALVKSIQANADDVSKQFHMGTGAFTPSVSAANTAGFSVYKTGAAATLLSECSTADVCVNVDPPQSASTQSLLASGFLWSTRTSTGAVPVDAALTNALRPSQWRVGDSTAMQDIAAYDASKTFIISDRWKGVSGASNGGFAKTPWSDWTGFRAWASALVVNAKAGGWAPEYWELANEPELFKCSTCTYFSIADRASATAENVLQMMLVEYQAVKAADPLAKIVAPSLSLYVDAVNAPTDVINMRTFLAFAAVNNMRLDAVTWHENADLPDTQDATTAPVVLTDHATRFRSLVARYPQVGQPLLFINEYGHKTNHLVPGWITGHMASFETTGVAQANRTCWGNECIDPSLDGLLVPSGSTWQGTSPAYWTYRAYADMDGAARLAVNSSMIWRFDGVAARDDATSTVRVLLGQHWGCAKASGNPYCAAAFDGGPMTASVSVAWPYAGSTARVSVYKIPAGVAAIAGPSLVSNTSAAVYGGRVLVPLSGIGDGDAVSVVLTK